MHVFGTVALRNQALDARRTRHVSVAGLLTKPGESGIGASALTSGPPAFLPCFVLRDRVGATDGLHTLTSARTSSLDSTPYGRV